MSAQFGQWVAKLTKKMHTIRDGVVATLLLRQSNQPTFPLDDVDEVESNFEHVD